MHETQRWRLVCYDIRDRKRYQRAHKVIKGYGEPVQYSIFRCRLDNRQTAELRWELSRLLTEEDSLLVIDLCHTCSGRVISQNHKAGWDAPLATFKIVLARPEAGEQASGGEEDQAPARARARKGGERG